MSQFKRVPDLRLIVDNNSSPPSTRLKIDYVQITDLPYNPTLNLCWISDRILLMGTPWAHETDLIHGHNNASEIGEFLDLHYFDRYMVFHLEEMDTSHVVRTESSSTDALYRWFRHQVILLEQEGAMIWTMSSLLEFCECLSSWLEINDEYVSVIHGTTKTALRCLTGLACFLKYTGRFDHVLNAWSYILNRRQEGEALSLPMSLKRTMHYFNDMIVMEGKVPFAECIQLHKIVIHSNSKVVPSFRRPSLEEIHY
jgi:hypothetical protein